LKRTQIFWQFYPKVDWIQIIGDVNHARDLTENLICFEVNLIPPQRLQKLRRNSGQPTTWKDAFRQRRISP
jgi:hypothetical protein